MLNLTPSLTATRPIRKDGDGDLDCALGREDGTVRYHENIGTRYQPKFASNSAGSVWARAWGVATPASDPFSSIYVGFSATPAWARLNGPQGPLTLFLGSVRGSFLAYQGNASGGSFQVRDWPPLPTFLLTLPSDPNPDSNPDSCWMGAGFAFRQQSPLPVHRKGSTIDDCRCSGTCSPVGVATDDMRRPLCDYFIASSHNTCLAGREQGATLANVPSRSVSTRFG